MILVVSATGMIDGMIPDSLLDHERQAMPSLGAQPRCS
jgi:hypothetical protein